MMLIYYLSNYQQFIFNSVYIYAQHGEYIDIPCWIYMANTLNI